MSPGNGSRHVSLLAIPEVMLSTLSSIHDALNCFSLLSTFESAVPTVSPYRVEIVAPKRSRLRTASGLPVPVHRGLDEIDRTDVVIIPSLLVEGGEWETGRYPEVVEWLRSAHGKGALMGSACSGALLLAETGLLDGLEATVHWAYDRTFRRNFPEVRLRVDRALVTAGVRRQFVMSGASASWHDLVLYLVARQVGPAAARAIARFMLLQWHEDGQAPYIVFHPPTDHGDATVLAAQRWLEDHYPVASPVEEMVRRSGLAERSFKRRFSAATGLAPLAYVQNLRVEEAKRRLERTDAAIETIGWNVGYEDPAFFRRLFKRITGITPGAYRRKFRFPGTAPDADEAGR